MSEKETRTIQELVRDVSCDNYNYGNGFGTVGSFPVVQEYSDTMRTMCANSDCPAKHVQFDHLVSKTDGEVSGCTGEVATFEWNPELDKFRVSGHFCPVCENLELRIDSETVRSEKGSI